jgi:hypothetical protein
MQSDEDIASTRVNSMTQRNEMEKLALLTVGTLFFLYGCGGGGAGVTTSSALVVSGTAATGAAMKNASITFKCQSKIYTAQGNTDGAYSISIEGNDLPCLVRASVPDNTLHSIAAVATGSATVNITPQTELVTSHLLAQSPVSAFDSNSIPTAAAASAEKINNSIAVVRDGINQLVNTSNFNPLTVQFSIGDTYDQKLDALKASLASKNITLSTLREAFIVDLPANRDRLSYIATVINSTSSVTVVDPPASINTAAVKDFLMEAFHWVSSNSSSNPDFFGFKLLKLENSLLRVNEYQKSAAENYAIPSQITYGESNDDLMLTTENAWSQVFYKGHILSGSQVNLSVNQVDYWLKLNSDSGQKGLGKWKMEVQTQDVSGLKISSFFNPVYTNNVDGAFATGSKKQYAWLKAIDSDYFVRKEKISNSGVTLDDFIAKYTNQIFCGSRILRFDGQSKFGGALFGIQFVQNANKAKLVPVDKDCNKVEMGYPVVELNLEKTSLNNQDVIELSGSKLPPYDSPIGEISDGYHPDESDPGYKYASDKYKLIVVKNNDGTFYTGVKTLSGANVSISPGNGPYLNRAALNSLLTVVGYPTFSQ